MVLERSSYIPAVEPLPADPSGEKVVYMPQRRKKWDPQWKDSAACKDIGTGAADVFFPEKGGSTRQGKAICARCSVKAFCLTDALINNEPGVWGGTSENEREDMRKRLGPVSLASPETVLNSGIVTEQSTVQIPDTTRTSQDSSVHPARMSLILELQGHPEGITQDQLAEQFGVSYEELTKYMHDIKANGKVVDSEIRWYPFEKEQLRDSLKTVRFTNKIPHGYEAKKGGEQRHNAVNELWNCGLTAKEIAHVTGYRERVIWNIVSKERQQDGTAIRRITDSNVVTMRLTRVKALLELGKSYREIGNDLGVSKRQVLRYVQRINREEITSTQSNIESGRRLGY